MSFQDLRGLIAGCALTFGLAATPVLATPTTYQFQGQLTSAGLFDGSSNADWNFAAGDTFTGTLVYDPDAVASSYDYIDQSDFKLTFHSSPVVSLTYTIASGGGSFTYAPPVEGSYAAISAGTPPSYPTGVDLRFQNYPLDGLPQYAVPADGFVGSYYAHSTFLSLTDFAGQPLTSTGADVDLAALFAALPPSDLGFSVRFSDPTRWNETPGVERIDGILFGRIDSFTTFASSAPEPASWAMMIVGIGATGGALRRRSAGKGKPALA